MTKESDKTEVFMDVKTERYSPRPTPARAEPGTCARHYASELQGHCRNYEGR